MKLTATELGWSTRRHSILNSVSLEVEPGKVLGLVGPNGSGKSTLLRLLSGILKPTSGHVFLKNRPLAELSRREVAQRIAFVEQQADTSERITVRDAVELGRTPWLSLRHPWGDADDALVAQALKDVGMDHFADRQWATLSGGERQRTHIARALVQKPGLLLLDEPTNHLDVHHQLSILALVSKLTVTTVVAIHDLNQAMDCDSVGVLDQGNLVAIGPPEEVLSVERLRDTFGVGVTHLTDPHDGRRIMRFHS
ncbi:histidinol phosphatase [Sedimentitalea sp. CY04]|uniref:Histidinol phosphatase n=1 Tax=Parasedimentitalea denitrificans TaxID=2211118 RepID=A0ABX0WD25_9RHOB|nr:ABC transporter ATP-binding protein [Sedimentitalea sp. CY04]NIZ63197.1 histidinol phosphatase [Sedimentitalea sp. CY04]